MTHSLARRVTSEFVGTLFLLMAVVGSGIMAERLAADNQAIALLANTIATGATLTALVLTFGPVSGAHLNPVVTLADASQGSASKSRGSGCLSFCLLISELRPGFRIPPAEHLVQFVVQDLGPRLQQQMGATQCPLH